jgi:protein TonB
MLQRISPSVAFLLSLFLHAMVMVPGLWLVRVPAPAPAPLTVDLPPVKEDIKETPAEIVSTQPAAQPAAEHLPPPSKHEEPQPTPRLPNPKALEKAQAALTKHLFYPPEAIARGLEGEVILLLILDASGRVSSAEIARSSGHSLLDQAALAAARQIGALPGNPKQTLLPVRFRLD